MITYRHLMLGVAMTLAAGAGQAQVQASRPFEQPGPTGDNRAATGHPAVQTPPTESSRRRALEKRPAAADADGNTWRKAAQPRHAPDFSTPGAPAENADR